MSVPWHCTQACLPRRMTHSSRPYLFPFPQVLNTPVWSLLANVLHTSAPSLQPAPLALVCFLYSALKRIHVSHHFSFCLSLSTHTVCPFIVCRLSLDIAVLAVSTTRSLRTLIILPLSAKGLPTTKRSSAKRVIYACLWRPLRIERLLASCKPVHERFISMTSAHTTTPLQFL